MKQILILSLFFITCISCSDSGSYNEITGRWNCHSWVNKDGGSNKCNENVYFEFRADKTYFSSLGNLKDSGTYTLLHKMLYVRPEGKLEFPVRINKLTSDTLQFLMNRGGTEEILTLAKVSN